MPTGSTRPPRSRYAEIARPIQRKVGDLTVELRSNPLTVIVKGAGGRVVQEVVLESDGTLSFKLDEDPVLGMGEGGPRPEKGRPWREQAVQFDRRGALDTMEPRWQSDMYGSRNPVAMLLGTAGWGMFVAAPWVHVDLRRADRGLFLPWKPTGTENVPQTAAEPAAECGARVCRRSTGLSRGCSISSSSTRATPQKRSRTLRRITGPAVMPPKWALGYMQSHRTLEDEKQMLGIIDTFRSKKIPIDAVIYLGTGFSPRGWNTKQPSFDFHPDVFTRDPKTVLADMHARNVKVVVHMVPWDRDKLPTLHGTIPAAAW